MRTVYLLGSCNFEVNGVFSLLRGEEKVTINDENVILKAKEGDVLILCFSSAPMLSWGCHLSRIKLFSLCTKARVIVLTPTHVPRLDSIMHLEKVIFIKGRKSVAQLNRALYCAISKPNPELWPPIRYIFNYRLYLFIFDMKTNKSILERANQERMPHKTAYHHRSMLIRGLGFSSCQHLQMFFTCINPKDIEWICTTKNKC